MGIQSKIQKGQVSGGSGVHPGGLALPKGRTPSMPSIQPKRECNIMGERKGGGSGKGSKGY